MDLRKYKYINNTKNLPGYADAKTPPTSGSGNSFNYGNAITSGLSAIGGVADAFNTSEYTTSNMLNKYGQNDTANINGVSFQQINMPTMSTINKPSVLSSSLGAGMQGAQFGSNFGPIGSAVGGILGLGAGLFGGISKQNAMERALQRARESADRTNTQNRSLADSTFLQQQYNKKNGNTTDDLLWYGKTGKSGATEELNGVTNSKHQVVTPVGKRTAYGNAMLAPGEVLRQNGNVQVVSPEKVKGSYKAGKDTEMALTNQESLEANNPGQVTPAPNDNAQVFGLNPATILGSNRTFAEHATEAGAPMLQKIQEDSRKVGKFGKLSSLSNATKELYEKNIKPIQDEINGRLDILAEAQAKQKNNEEMKNFKYKTGKIPAYADSKIPYGSVMPFDLEAGMSVLDYLNHSRANVNVPSTYVENPYSNYAANQMLALKDSPDKYLNAINDQYRYGLYDLANSGGLTPGQRMLQRISLNLGTQRNKASALSEWKKANDQIASNAYSMMNQSGEASAQRMQNANALRYENMAKAYGAKENMISADKSNFLKAIQSKAKNTNDWNMYQKTLGLYQEQNKNTKEANDIWKNIYNNKPSTTEPVFAPQESTFDYTKPLPWLTNDKLIAFIR